MKCSCCGGDADTVLETEASGVSFMCEDCVDAWFSGLNNHLWPGAIEHGQQG